MNKDKSKIIFSDVDGTIYSHDQTWSDTTQDSIKKVMDKGIEFVVCTGNPYFERMMALHNKINNQYFIGSSGAIVYDIWNDKIVFESSVDEDEAKKIFDLANEEGLSIHWWDSKGIWGNEHMTDGTIDILRRYISHDVPAKRVNSIGPGIQKMEFYFRENPENEEKLNRIIEKLDTTKLSLARIAGSHLEITSINATKGRAALELLKYLELQDAKVMTVGDSANDHSMFEITEYSFAMDNAPQATKDLANYLTKDVKEDGLGHAMEAFLEMTK